MTKLLLIACALLEATAGLALLLIPAVTVSLLAGAPLDTPGGLIVGRIAGAALLSLAIVCWQTRNGERVSNATSVVAAMLVYNAAAAAVLVYAGLRLKLQSTFLWPLIVIHWVLAGWCLVNVWMTRRQLSNG